MRKRKRWFALVALFLIAIVCVAQCLRPPERRTITTTFGNASALTKEEKALVDSTSVPATGLAKQVDDWNVSPPSSAFPAATITRGSVDEAPAAVATEGRFFVSIDGAYTSATPAVYDGILLVGGRSGSDALRFYGFDARTGDSKWVVNVQDEDAYSPACDEGVCAFTTGSCSLYVVEAATGKPRWGRYLAGSLLSAPAIAQGHVFASYPKFVGAGLRPPKTTGEMRRYLKRLAANPHAAVGSFDLVTGASTWQRWIASDALISLQVRGTAVVAANYAGATEFDLRNGNLLSARSSGIAGYAVATDRSHQVIRTPDSIASMDAAGTAVWRTSIRNPTDPIFAGGSIIVGTADGDLLRVDPSSGAIVHRWTVGSAVLAEPVVDQGWIYAATADGVIAIDSGDRSLTGWSQWGGDAQRSKALVSKWSSPYFSPMPTLAPTPASTIAAIETPPELEYLAPSPTSTPDDNWELP